MKARRLKADAVPTIFKHTEGKAPKRRLHTEERLKKKYKLSVSSLKYNFHYDINSDQNSALQTCFLLYFFKALSSAPAALSKLPEETVERDIDFEFPTQSQLSPPVPVSDE